MDAPAVKAPRRPAAVRAGRHGRHRGADARAEDRHLRDALLFALIVGVGYLVANTTTIAINPNFPRPLLYAAISGTYNLVGIMIVSVLDVAIR
jgi:hypothetical protein